MATESIVQLSRKYPEELARWTIGLFAARTNVEDCTLFDLEGLVEAKHDQERCDTCSQIV